MYRGIFEVKNREIHGSVGENCLNNTAIRAYASYNKGSELGVRAGEIQ